MANTFNLNGERGRAFLAAAALFVLYFAALGHVPLNDPDEARYTLIPKEMIAARDFVTPRLNGVLYFEKPPLYYWLNAVSVAAFGPGPWGARFWCAALGLASVGLVWRMTRSMAGPGAGRFAAFVLATAPLQLAMSRIATLDMALAFFVSAVLAAFWWARREDAPPAAWYAVFAAAAMALLAKGLVGALIPAAVVFLFLWVRGEWSLLRRIPWAGGLSVLLGLAAPWHVAMAMRHPDWFDFYIVREHFLRYLTPEANRPGPPWYFVPVLLVGFLPWLPAAAAAAAALLRGGPTAPRHGRADVVFLLLWAGFVFAFFSVSKSKLPSYILPAAPPLAGLVGIGLDRVATIGRRGALMVCGAWSALLAAPLAWIAFAGYPEGGVPPQPTAGVVAASAVALASGVCAVLAASRGEASRAVAAIALAGGAFFGGLWEAAPAFLVGRNADPVASYLRVHAGPRDRIYCFGACVYSLGVALDRQVDAVRYDGELDFGIAHLAPEERARRFPTLEEFRPLWESGTAVWVLADRRDPSIRDRGALAGAETAFESGKLILLRNRAASR